MSPISILLNSIQKQYPKHAYMVTFSSTISTQSSFPVILKTQALIWHPTLVLRFLPIFLYLFLNASKVFHIEFLLWKVIAIGSPLWSRPYQPLRVGQENSTKWLPNLKVINDNTNWHSQVDGRILIRLHSPIEWLILIVNMASS